MERSAESDTAPQCDEEPKADEDATSQSAGKEEPVKEQDLQAQVCVWHKWMFLPETLGDKHWQRSASLHSVKKKKKSSLIAKYYNWAVLADKPFISFDVPI